MIITVSIWKDRLKANQAIGILLWQNRSDYGM